MRPKFSSCSLKGNEKVAQRKNKSLQGKRFVFIFFAYDIVFESWITLTESET
jgi:hypothetical protein